MAGYFTAIVRAPITGIILITEMTGSFTHLLSLSVVSIISYIVADLLKVLLYMTHYKDFYLKIILMNITVKVQKNYYY